MTEITYYVNSYDAEYEPAILKDSCYEIKNAGNLYWFAAKVNGGDNAINGKLMTDINLIPVHTFTFVTDSGLI